MEHSYSKDIHPEGNVEVMATRSILIPRPPQCPSCHQHSSSDDILAKLESQQTDPYFDQLPPALNDNIAKMAMDETDRLTKNVKNNNPDDEDWDEKVNKFGWTTQMHSLYRQVSNILDYDQLARLAVSGRQNEGIIRRCSIDKSVARMRMALASVHWNPQLTQWIHGIMSDHLPPTYMASYLDILQTLRTKVPTLVDKMLANKPVSFNQEYMSAVTKRPWGANVPTKSRKLPGQSPIIVIVPATLHHYSINQQPSSRLKRWFSLLGTMASIAPIQNTVRSSQSLDIITEQLIGITRSKIQDLRNEMPNRHIILVGINTGASVALQVALVESVSSVICLGFSFNTMNGVRGQPDDRILELTTPVLFVLGECSARSSQEEIESLRERMCAQTMLLKVGSADHALRIPKFNRHLEGVTQSMVDNMIADEIQDFVATCILNPPGPREVTANHLNKRLIGTVSMKNREPGRKRKHKNSASNLDKGPPRKVGRPRLNRSNEIPTGDLKPEKPKPAQALLKQNNESIKIAAQNVSNQIIDIASLPIETANTIPDISIPSTNLMEPIAIDIKSIENISQIETAPIVTSPLPIITTVATAPNIVSPSSIPAQIQQGNQFIQIKPPMTTGRIQSTNVKNFFIKGMEKQHSSPVPVQPTASASITPMLSPNQISGNKKIIIKSQQIIVPASNVKQQNNQTASPQTSVVTSLPLTVINNNSPDQSMITTTTTSSDLSGILDLPILFADSEPSSSEPTLQQQQQQNTSTPIVSSPNAQIVSIATDTIPTSNILITSPEGKLPNRPVVISAAKIGKTVNVTQSNNKVILINRGQIKQQIVQTQSAAPIVKGMQTIKLVPTSSLSSNQMTFSPNNITKLAPGTKIDLSQLKLVKNQNTIQKQVFINKPSGGTVNIGGRTATTTHAAKNAAIIFKSTTPAGQQQQQQQQQINANAINVKANMVNRNITVRKVVSVPSSTATGQSNVVISSPQSSPPPPTPQPSQSSASTPSPVKTTTITSITSPTANKTTVVQTTPSPRILRKSKIPQNN